MNNVLIHETKLFSMYLLAIFFLIVFMPSFAESLPEYGLTTSEYHLEIDEHQFTVPYNVNADVLDMAIDPELNSLLIGLKNTDDSIMVVKLDNNLINATNNEFAILVNGFEVDYDIITDDNRSTLSFFVPAFTEEVEIIGTHVIPEFPLGAIITLSLVIPVILILSKRKVSFFRL